VFRLASFYKPLFSLLPHRATFTQDGHRMEMAVEVSRALSQRDPNLVLSSAFKLCITQRDLASLQEGSWLNDEVINFYLSLVMIHSSSAGQGLKVYSFSTFFFPKLHGGGHSAVKRWTKAVDLFQYDIILVPLHLGVHCPLPVIIWFDKSTCNLMTIFFVISFCKSVMYLVHPTLYRLYLREEHKARKNQDLDACKWTVGSLRASEIPQQKNGSDCGVFACKYADYIAQGRPLNFRQVHRHDYYTASKLQHEGQLRSTKAINEKDLKDQSYGPQKDFLPSQWVEVQSW
uniref:Ubiquitin-like protease family profile domain-containing protein n=1 Tax=Oncorhynchus kisutch TaxID=8019 RepID=A0A8C7GEF0_ONCKI